MMEETSPRTSAKWRPRDTYANQAGVRDGLVDVGVVQAVERKGSAF